MMTALNAVAEVRTWTSTDGTKTFEAEFKGIKGDEVTVIRGGVERVFSMKVLSEADQKWLTEIRQQQPLREWTKGGTKMMAEFISKEGTMVTLQRGYNKVKVAESSLSEADREWLKNNAAKYANKGGSSDKGSSGASAGALMANLKGKTVKLDGGKLVKSDLDRSSKNYILYFTASW